MVWVGVPGFAKYQVRHDGAVRRAPSAGGPRAGRVLKPGRSRSGYVTVTLMRDDGVPRTMRVHRLVCAAFLNWALDDAERTPDHIDRDITNNRLHNLRLATRKEQRKNQGERRKHACISVPVEQWTVDGELVARFASHLDAAKAVGAPNSRNISAASSGRFHTAYGFVWKRPAVDHRDLPGEEWKAVGAGLVSNMNRFRRVQGQAVQAALRAPDLARRSDGYPMIGKRAFHRVVAELFLPPPDDPAKVYVNHKNGDVTDASAANLEWVTMSENVRHAFATGLNPIMRAVVKLDRGGADLQYFDSITAAARATGALVSSICTAINVGTKVQFAGGFKWRRAAEGETRESVEAGVCPKALAAAAPKPFRRAIVKLDANGNDLEYFDSLTKAAAATDASVPGLCIALRAANRFAGGFKWRYAADGETRESVEASASACVATAAAPRPFRRRVAAMSTDGVEHARYDSMTQAAAAMGVSAAAISVAARKGTRSCGFQWAFV